jgi:hypothetical protein
MSTEPSAIVIPFGKHKGKTVAELLTADPQYADWIAAQAWVAERFAELHAAILTRGAGTDDTPEHNALQARFLDERFCLALIQITSAARIIDARADCLRYETYDLRMETGKARSRLERVRSNIEWKTGQPPEQTKYPLMTLEEDEAEAKALTSRIATLEQQLQDWRFEEWPSKISVDFECRGVDVRLDARFQKGGEHFNIDVLGVEIKPSVGDDYPSVMRQMKRLGAGTLVAGTWTGRGVSEPQMRAMFEASGIKVVFVQEIEERMRLP